MAEKKKRKIFLKDPRFSKKELQNAPDLAQDHRKMVGIDDAFKDADVEDKVWLFWQRNRSFILTIAVVLIVAVIAVQGYQFYQKQENTKMQASYSQIMDEAQRTQFAKEYPNTPLGGFARLQIADQEYSDGNYSAAAKDYQAAMSPLSGSALESRVRLGNGISLIKSGQTDQGTAALKQLANNRNMLEAVRAEAAYNIALLAVKNDNLPEARTWLDFINKLQYNGVWQTQANVLKQNNPQLADPSPPIEVAKSE